MRRHLLAAAAIAGLVGLSAPARAQLAVADANGELSLVQQVAVAGKQLVQLQQQYSELVSTYNQVTAQYNMLTQFANPNGVATELEQPFLQNPLPNISTLPGTLTGGSGLGGTPYGQTFYNANQYSAPVTNYPGGALMGTQQTAIASIQGTAAQNLESLQERIAGLTDLQTQLNSATTIQQVASINARISAENTYVSSQQAQATNLSTITTAQVAAQEQARQQLFNADAAKTAAAYPSSIP